MIQSLDVFLWDRKVGTLISSKKGYKHQICFYFDAEYAHKGLDLAPLRAPLAGVPARNGLPIYPESNKLFAGLPSFIADSMPDHWGNILFNEWAKAKHISSKDLTALDRLAYIGRRGMGALEFAPPTDVELEKPFPVEIAQLSELAQSALKEANGFHAYLSPDLAIESLFKVGTSAGGRRPKAVINLNLETRECYSGQSTMTLPGFTPMIIKFDEHTDIPTTRIEYSYYLMALTVGLNMMPSNLIASKDETHFLTNRFDRTASGEKIHVQTLAAMYPNASSYEDLFEVAQQLNIPPRQIKMLYLQMVMNVLTANIDDHNKNFSFIMNRDGTWSISPAYDFTFTVDPSAPFYVNCHSMTINGKDRDITKDDLTAVADRFNIKGASGTIEDAIATVRDYRKFATEAKVNDIWIQKIESEINHLINLL